MNSNWNNDGSVTEFNYVDISVAVATDNGLFTPVVKHACTKSLENISKEVKAFAIKAKEGKLLPEDYTGGSVSISNLGMYGIEEFSAIINPPQAGIIAIGDILEDVNVIVKRYVDDLLEQLTGREGIYASKIVFIGKKTKHLILLFFK